MVQRVGTNRRYKGGNVMGLVKQCNRFCVWLGRCLNQHEGDCMGYAEPDDEDDIEDRLDEMTY